MTAAETRQPFLVHCGVCSHEWAAAYLPMAVEVFVTLCKSPCPMCGSKNVLVGAIPKATPEGDPTAWLASGDTGISSETIFGVMMGRQMGSAARFGNSPPSDPSDFGRCYRLLKVMPSWRERLPEVASQFPKWKPFVDSWGYLTALYETELRTGKCPALYERMRDLRAQT